MKQNRTFPSLFKHLSNSRKSLLTFLFSFFTFFLFPQDHFLDSLLKAGLPQYTVVLTKPSTYKLQVFYTQIDRDSKNAPHFTEHSFHKGGGYVYPASTVKLPMSVLALMKLEELDIKHLDRDAAMITDSVSNCRKLITVDSSSGKGYPTLGNYIKKMLLVSDNQAFARTFDFVTYDYAHEHLKTMGFENIRLLNRLESQCSFDTVPATLPVFFLKTNGDTIYKQGRSFLSGITEHPGKNSTAGVYHQNARGRWEKGPKDFSQHNYLEPKDLHQLMERLVFNNHTKKSQRLPLSDKSREFLLKQLGSYPRESDYPSYNPKQYYDSYKKYLMYGSSVAQIQQDSIRVINIVGRAYGFLIDCAYIIDLKNNLEFLVTAVIYVNKNGRIGSGKYEYDQLGLPFMRDLGWCLYSYERNRKREHAPDLSEFRDLFK